MKSQRGFTLVEVLVVLSVLIASVFLSAEVLNQMDRSVRYPEAQVNLGALSTVIRETLRYQTTCENSLANSPGIDEIQMLLPGILGDTNPTDDRLQAGAKVQHLEITSLKLVNTVNLGPGPTPGSQKYFSQIELAAKVASTGFQLKPITVGGFYYTLLAGSITSCDTPGEDPVPLCVEMGCTWDPAVTPNCQCTAIDLTCPPQEFLTGIAADGKQLCTPLGAGPCPAGTYLRAVSIGAKECSPL